MTRTVRFRSKKDGRAFKIKAPESCEDIEENDFIEVDGKIRMAEEIQFDDPQWERLSESVPREGELLRSDAAGRLEEGD